MSIITATRRIQFCAGHRVHNHESKCRNMHGHNYVALFTAQADQGLDKLGRVIDFSVLKEKLGGWIDQNFDHGFIYWKEDFEMARLFGSKGTLTASGQQVGQCDTHKQYALPENPTAENIARHLLTKVAPFVLFDTAVKVIKVTLWETENCYAEVSL